MRSWVSLLFLLVLLLAPHGTAERTPLTVLMDDVMTIQEFPQPFLEKVLNSVSARFPCVTRQYTTIILNTSETNEIITNNKKDFLKSIRRNNSDLFNMANYYNYPLSYCNQSLLYGVKRALEISPAESIILVYTIGSMADCDDTQLLSDARTLLEKKKSQVYILWFAGWLTCDMSASQQDIFNETSTLKISLQGSPIDYKLFHLLQFLLAKPLNSTMRILNINPNVTDKYTEVFDVPASLTYLLIMRDERFFYSFTDPNGNRFTFDESEYYFDYDFLFHNFGTLSSHLIKSPASGSWILSARGKGLLTVQILGITGLDKSGNCSDSDCHPNATCLEFGGYGECTCKEGFAGDGTSCNDINECQDRYTNNCYYYDSCVNTIGSYTCNCPTGFEYKDEIGCVNSAKCADSSLNDCDPVAICTYYNSAYYTCTCPYGYYGDGRHCEINECQQGTPCGSNEDCIKFIGSYSCIDPCSNHTVLNDPWRSTSNTHNYNNWYHCDYGLSGWYRFKGEYDQQIPEHCIPQYSCGTTIPIWMNGSHPTGSDGIVNHTACPNWYDGCCTQPYNISVKMCPGGFYVYKLQGTPVCNSAYCTESNYSCSGVDCAPDEECRIVDNVPGCYCKDSSYGLQPGNLAGDLTPQVVCGLENIEVRFSKCLMEKWGYNTSALHLRDYSCRGVIERGDKSYITFITRPADGSCGGYTLNDGTEITYTNTVYLASQSDGVIIRDEYPIDFHCYYPSDMEINRLTAISSYVVSAIINVAGTANFTITMGLFQDSSYTTPYTASQVWLDSSSILYVGVIVTGATGSSPFVLVMKNCYATPTADSSYGPRYDILTNQCPNKNDPTLSVAENGVSLKGRFSLQVFKFLGGFNQIYLHCQVGLCDTSSNVCSTPTRGSLVFIDQSIRFLLNGGGSFRLTLFISVSRQDACTAAGSCTAPLTIQSCSSRRSASISNNDDVKNMTIGPIIQKVTTSLSSGAGTVIPTAKLFISSIVFLLLLY